jgi:O-antigen/teichoic acid export membrane protein
MNFLRIPIFNKNISIYFLINVTTPLIPLLTLPVFTKYLTPHDYGVLTLFNILCMYSANLFRMEINSALKRFYVSSYEEFSSYINTAFWLANLLLIFFMSILIILSPWIDKYKGLDKTWYFVILLLAYLRFHSVILHHLFQLNNRALIFSLWGISVNFGTFAIAYLIILQERLTWEARAISEILIALLLFPLTVYFLQKDFKLQLQFYFSIKAIKRMLVFSSPILLATIVGYILISLDRIFIAEFVGIEDLGLYAVAVQLSAAVGIIYGSILPVWESWIYQRKNNLTNLDFINIFKALFYLSIASFIIYLALPDLILFIIPYLIDKKFVGVDYFIRAVTLSAILSALLGMVYPVINFLQVNKFIAYLNIVMLAISVPLLYYFVSAWGGIGAAYAVAIVNGVGYVSAILYLYLLYRSKIFLFKK